MPITLVPVFLSLFALTGASVEGRKLCQNSLCDTCNEGKAEAGLCANVSVKGMKSCNKYIQ